MKRRLFGTVGSLAAILLLASCTDDPTAALRGDIASVRLSRSYVELDVGESAELTATAYDSQGNAVGTLPEVTTSDAAIVSAVRNDTTSGDPLPKTVFRITALAPGQVTLSATAGGVTSDPSTVVSFPTVFGGSVAVAASGFGWDIVTVTATSNVKFDPDNTTAMIGGVGAYIHSITADELQLVHSAPAAASNATVQIANLVFLSDFAVTSLDATTEVSVSAFQNYMTDNIATAPDLTAGPFPLTFYGMVSSAVPDVIAMFAPAADLAMSSSVYWLDSGTDIDVFYTDAGDSFINCLGCGGSNPEEGSWTVTGADTNYFYVELWSGNTTVFQVVITSP